MRRASSLRKTVKRALFRAARTLPLRGVLDRNLAQFVTYGYRVMLLREPDAQGFLHFYERLASGEISKQRFIEILRGSDEFRKNIRFSDLLNSLHLSRCDFIQGLPRARRILDLGGAHGSDPQGAMVAAGYPYQFEKLVIVDLPLDERHELYQEGESYERVETDLGPVFYRYHSMTDFSGFAPSEFDLVYSGQSIEHVTEDEADQVFEGIMKVVEPGGFFALDTPNGRICRLQQKEFINPDHRVEYTHEELSEKLEKSGFKILEAKGLNYVGRSAAKGRFSMEEAAANRGIFFEIEDCYLLSYLCRKV